jgi:hypothetical protein
MPTNDKFKQLVREVIDEYVAEEMNNAGKNGLARCMYKLCEFGKLLEEE